MPAPVQPAPRLPRLGFALQALGRTGLAAWAGLAAGWLALAVVHRSGGWCPVLVVASAVVVALPSLVPFVAGHLLLGRATWRVPAVAGRVARAVAAAAFCAGAAWAYLGGWPR